MAPGTRTPNGRKLTNECAGLPRDLSTGIATKTVAEPGAVYLRGQTPEPTPNTAPKNTTARPLTPAVTGAGAQRREPKAVRFWRPVDRLVSGRSPPKSPLAPNAECPLPNSLHHPNGWRKEPERKGYPPDYRLRRTAPRLGHVMNTDTAGHCGNQTRQRIFRPWRSPE